MTRPVQSLVHRKHSRMFLNFLGLFVIGSEFLASGPCAMPPLGSLG